MISLTKADIVSDLAHVYVEGYSTSYVDAVEKAENVEQPHVLAHDEVFRSMDKSVNSDSKQFNDSISLDEDIDNGEIYNIKTEETIKEL